ncbi:MAG: PTS lactose/cellobiose transporter subunit IIA [Longicatena sp.]
MNETSFELILHAGNSKSSSMEAIELARAGDVQEADYKINEAHEELVFAQKIHTKLLAKHQKIDESKPDMLLVHAQDHLSAAQIELDMAKEIINLHEQLQEIKRFLGMENFRKQKYVRILLVCGQGMSTSLLVQSMYLYAEEGDYIESSSFEELTGVIAEYDVILVSPQIRYRIPVIERMMTPRTQVIGLMDMKAYGKLDGRVMYEQAKSLFMKISR